MKKIIKLLMALLLIVGVTSCNKEASNDGKSAQNDKENLSFAFVVTNQLGDKSFNDSAAAGMKKIADSLGYKTKIIEIGREQTQFEPTLLDLTDSGEYTAIFLNGSDYQEIVERIAPEYPEQKYVLFDTQTEKGPFDNVRSIAYKQNEASYLAGVLASLVTSSDMKFANPEHKIGFIGGDENPIINDFLVGYIEGARSILDDVDIYVSYAGSWTDTALVKEIANAQFNSGVDITFPCAMTAGNGAIESAVENDKYIIGVDSDQALIYEEQGDLDAANIILTSVIKNVGESLYLYAKDLGNGEDVASGNITLGLEDGTVGIAENKFYEENVSQENRDKVNEAKEGIISGKIKVSTALKTPQSEIDKLIEEVSPQSDK